MNDTLPLSIQPVISYPKEAEVGKTYLMEIDLQMTESGFEWQYEEEEYLIYCMVNVGNLFTVTSVGEPAIVLHRFGGTYGNAKFLLEAGQEENEGEIKITLVNSWGVPIKLIYLTEIQVIEQLDNLPVLTPIEIVRQQNLILSDIGSLVQEVKQKIASDVTVRCGTMRVLDMVQSVDLDRIYTDVNIIKNVTARQRIGYDEVMEVTTREHFDRFLARATQERITGIEAVEEFQKLMVLGRPGAGKTTFMKYLAMSCIGGQFHAELVPIFVTLKAYAEEKGQPSLENYILTEFQKHEVTEDVVKRILKEGRALILLEGLDEVKKEDDRRVKQDIDRISRDWLKNRFAITCRIAAREYTFENFTEVEVADFDEQQIATFAKNWFREKGIKAENFLSELRKYREVKELATSPLLLSLLCLVFEESRSFPNNRAELYKEGIDTLFRKWDMKRGIRRDSLYMDLSVRKKEDMLSQIALITFEKGDYFVSKRHLEDYIYDYIRKTMTNAKTNDQELHLDSEAVLNSIEAQHGLLVERARGIYSFPHISFHEYFVARQIVVSASPKQLDAGLQKLVAHVTDKRWREVFCLVMQMLIEADQLAFLIKQEIDKLVALDDTIQEFIDWVHRKSSLVVSSSYKLPSLRAFYFNLVVYLSFPNPKLDTDFDMSGVASSNFDLNLDYNLCNLLSQALYGGYTITRLRTRIFESDYSINNNEELNAALQELKQSFFIVRSSIESYQQGWQDDLKAWAEQLRTVMIKYRDIGYDWQFTEYQASLLEDYYYVNKLLDDCINSDIYISREARQEIESTLLSFSSISVPTLLEVNTTNSELPFDGVS